MVMQKGMQNLKYDRTIQCVIKEIKNEKTGEYLVQYNNKPVFSAFSEIKYAINDIVYVVIPEGDFNNQKFITGKISSIQTLPEIINASQKSDLFLGFQKFTMFTPDNVIIKINSKNDFQSETLTNFQASSKKANYLLVSFKAQTNFQKYSIVQGEYGLEIEITGQIKEEEEKLVAHTEKIYFTCKDMLSNPYVYYNKQWLPLQRKLIDISNFESIDTVTVTPYQDNNFMYVSENDTFESVSGELTVQLSEVSIETGIAPESIGDNEIVLYTLDSLTYGDSSSSSASQAESRTLKIAWMYTDNDGKRTLIEVPHPDLPIKIIWEWQNEEKTWVAVENGKEVKEEELQNTTLFNYNFEPDTTKPSYKFRVKIILTTEEETDEKKATTVIYRSNIVTFSNAVDTETLDKAIEENNRFSITIHEVSKENGIILRSAGSYFYLYDKNGNLFSKESGKQYCLQLNDSELEDSEKMTVGWILPNQDHSMIIPIKQNSENKDKYHCFFEIKPQLNDNYDDNTIKTTITVNNHTYELSTTLVFKTKAVFNDSYTIKLYDKEKQEYITHFTSGETLLQQIEIQCNLGAITKTFQLTEDLITGIQQQENWDEKTTVTIGDMPILSFNIPDDYNKREIPIKFSIPVVAPDYDISCLNRIEVDSDENIVFFDDTPFQIYKDDLEDLTTQYNIKISAQQEGDNPAVTFTNYQAFLDSTAGKKFDKIHSVYELTVEGVASCAILTEQHEYSSNLVNTWEGKPVVQVNNNTALQQVLAAGTRDCQGRYSGVVLGAGESGQEKKYGLYGYFKNNKTFGLMIDGTGFIGPDGKGQIQFDGNSATIKNADNSCWINLNPGITDSINDSFLYMATNKREAGKDMSQFLNDLPNEKDYFIVHPNYGIFTSGIVFSNGTVESAEVAWLNFSETEGDDTWAGSAHIGLLENTVNFISLEQQVDAENTVPLFTIDKRTGNLSLSDSGIISFGSKGKIQSNENYLTISKNFATINIRDEEVEIVCNDTQLSITSDGVQIDSLDVKNLKINNTPLDDYIKELVK